MEKGLFLNVEDSSYVLGWSNSCPLSARGLYLCKTPMLMLGIFLKVPFDSITPGWIFLKKWILIDSKSFILNFCTLTGVITDSFVSKFGFSSLFWGVLTYFSW
jgi:hypothetical protein